MKRCRRAQARGAIGVAAYFASAVLAGACAAGGGGQSGASAARGEPGSGPARDPVVLISIDGFHPDYLDSFPVPNLRRLVTSGVRARWMTPVFPTKTFPNHYTIVTGLIPAHHGIVGNNFIDPVDRVRFRYTDTSVSFQRRWWHGEPVWLTAESQGVRAASFFWPGSDVAISGRRPTRWKPFNARVPNPDRVDSVLSWLTGPAAERPGFVTLYFEAVDHSGHERGPRSPELAGAVALIDSMIGRLVAGLERAGLVARTNLVIVSDHGMIATSEHRLVFLEDYLDPASVQVFDLGPLIALEPRDGNADRVVRALSRAPHLRVFHRDSTPERWRIRGERRLAPVIGVPEDGWLLTTRASLARRGNRYNGGDHGFDEASPGMRALFIASGPAFGRGRVVEPFSSLHVYELICEVLGLRPAANDGSLDSVRAVLR